MGRRWCRENDREKQWWRAMRRTGTTTLDISLPLCTRDDAVPLFIFSLFYFHHHSSAILFLAQLFLSHCLCPPSILFPLQNFVTGSWLPWTSDITLFTVFNQMSLSFHRAPFLFTGVHGCVIVTSNSGRNTWFISPREHKKGRGEKESEKRWKILHISQSSPFLFEGIKSTPC